MNDDLDITISLSTINEIYLGFDEVFKLTSVKNFGAFWQPLRIEFYNGHSLETVYLIIDHNGLFAHNKTWYETLIHILQA